MWTFLHAPASLLVELIRFVLIYPVVNIPRIATSPIVLSALLFCVPCTLTVTPQGVYGRQLLYVL